MGLKNLCLPRFIDKIPWAVFAKLEFNAFVYRPKRPQAICMMNKLRKTLFFALFLIPVYQLKPAAAQTDLPDFDFGKSAFGQRSGDDAPVTLQAEFTAAKGEQPARLFITAKIKSGWHIYSITQPPGGPIRTEIKLAPSDQYKLNGEYQSHPKPTIAKEAVFDNLDVETHDEIVTWHAPIALSPGVDPANLKIVGTVNYQPCDPNSCYPPKEAKFTASLGQGVEIPAEELTESPPTASPTQEHSALKVDENKTPEPGKNLPQAAVFSTPKTDELLWRPFSIKLLKQLLGPTFDIDEMKANLKDQQTTSLAWELLFGFLGGLILNIMPCVLPVIGLKILAFIEQSGKSRWNNLALNLWYSLGLISVFMILATLAAFAQFGWGQLFQYTAFNIAVAAVIFVMGLSFLGVWEMPIPGFIGSGKATELSSREGAWGAFFKGVITTLLATPCAGPFMVTAIAWAIKQPPLTTYLVFFSVGLGMASPYLLIGAFPALIRFLPKPGAWMDTFKQTMGFVLLGTVVYIFTFLDWPYVVPSLGLLIACWIGCWWIGRTPLYAELKVQVRTWIEATAFVALAWLFLFPGLKGITDGRVNWSGLHEIMASRLTEKYDRQIAKYLDAQQAAGNELVHTGRTAPAIDETSGPYTVMVDFTADWCVNCKVFEATVLHSEAVANIIKENGVVLLKADCTNSKEINDANTMLYDNLGAGGVPTIAIFPAKSPNTAFLFFGAYSQKEIIEALDKAGPSKSNEP
jgi:thiol:disulfide interchange protein DsbD